MIRSTGVDIVEIKRMEKALKSHAKLAVRVFTPQEIACCKRSRHPWASFAARFAAKEAVSKALGTGIGRVKWTDIEVIGGKTETPQIKLHEAAEDAAAEQGISQILLSLSHCREYAIAFVTAY